MKRRRGTQARSASEGCCRPRLRFGLVLRLFAAGVMLLLAGLVRAEDQRTATVGMSGRIVLGAKGPHTRFQFIVEGEAVTFNDARRFGRVGCELPEFGPEPLSEQFDAATLFLSQSPGHARPALCPLWCCRISAA